MASKVVKPEDFGGVGDGQTDDTEAVQKALDEAASTGTRVQLEANQYRIEDTLVIPANVTLRGVLDDFTSPNFDNGSILLAVSGAGEPDGEPFITMKDNSTVQGFAVFYPEQTTEPVPYPWTIRGDGENCSVVDMLLINPYQAIDFATNPSPRHHIRNLNSQPLYHGIAVDHCVDIGRIEQVHFWPFWRIHESLFEFSQTEATAFSFGRTDWEYITDCFSIFFNRGFHFFDGEDGSANGMLSRAGADLTPCAVHVEDVQDHAGITFSDTQLMAGVEVAETNSGPVKFTNCGFYGIENTASHAVIDGDGTVSFDNCHFTAWDRDESQQDAPAIDVRSGAATITGSDFMDAGSRQIEIGGSAESVILSSSRLRGGKSIVDHSKDADVQVGLNTTKGETPENPLITRERIQAVYPTSSE